MRGKATWRRTPWAWRWDHPRACGEKPLVLLVKASSGGSPPRVRGKDGLLGGEQRGLGITPARAGKRIIRPLSLCVCWDHPRACGEKPTNLNADTAAKGSPPRVRGKGGVYHACLPHHGITPARAGKSADFEDYPVVARDHPRACGEKSIKEKLCITVKGSPPRVRGKGGPAWSHRGRGRITPARAGKRCSELLLVSRSRDHPRACGEKSTGLTKSPSSRGSPPRVRGKANSL